MLNAQKQSLGGQATALILRKKALEAYYKNPNICHSCSSIIMVKEHEKVPAVRKKKYCNKLCLGKAHKLKWIDFPKKRKTKKFINKSKFYYLENLTKGKLFQITTNWQSARGCIQKHARFVFEQSNQLKKCRMCSYDKHYEVCHIKGVSDFNEDSLIVEEINKIENLMALCPNHHWEFDNNLIDISDF